MHKTDRYTLQVAARLAAQYRAAEIAYHANNRDTDYCVHGNYIGNWAGPDYICGYCEHGVTWHEIALQDAAELVASTGEIIRAATTLRATGDISASRCADILRRELRRLPAVHRPKLP